MFFVCFETGPVSYKQSLRKIHLKINFRFSTLIMAFLEFFSTLKYRRQICRLVWTFFFSRQKKRQYLKHLNLFGLNPINFRVLYLCLFLQLRSYLTEVLLDQLPVLGELQRYLEHLAIMDPPPAKRDLLLEQVRLSNFLSLL